MMAIFNFFGSILGYLLWFLYNIFHNYGVAIIFFTIIIKVVLFPFSIKQQRSMASQSKMAEKQKELQKIYGNNKQKYNEELAKLYEKEGVNPGAGCLTTLIPFPIMLGIYYSVIMPLSNTLHIASDRIQEATDFISRIPGMVSTMTSSGIYSEMEVIRNFDALRDHLTMFTPEDLDKIGSFASGFKFLGLDLLATPQGSDFLTFLWVIPALSLISSFGFQFYMTHTQKMTTGQTQPGCMKAMMYVLPLISVYWAWIMPTAVGLYWVISSVTSFAQTLVTNKYFSVNHMVARSEAQRAVTLELAEAKVQPLPPAAQQEIAQRLASAPQQQKQEKSSSKKQGGKKKKSGSGNFGNSSDYMGTKK
jgi:YidC/Oxa1 family membrane protein insertase